MVWLCGIGPLVTYIGIVHLFGRRIVVGRILRVAYYPVYHYHKRHHLSACVTSSHRLVWTSRSCHSKKLIDFVVNDQWIHINKQFGLFTFLQMLFL